MIGKSLLLENIFRQTETEWHASLYARPKIPLMQQLDGTFYLPPKPKLEDSLPVDSPAINLMVKNIQRQLPPHQAAAFHKHLQAFSFPDDL